MINANVIPKISFEVNSANNYSKIGSFFAQKYSAYIVNKRCFRKFYHELIKQDKVITDMSMFFQKQSQMYEVLTQAFLAGYLSIKRVQNCNNSNPNILVITNPAEINEWRYGMRKISSRVYIQKLEPQYGRYKELDSEELLQCTNRYYMDDYGIIEYYLNLIKYQLKDTFDVYSYPKFDRNKTNEILTQMFLSGIISISPSNCIYQPLNILQIHNPNYLFNIYDKRKNIV